VGELLRTYATRWKKVLPITTGHDLRERGLRPGPLYRSILGSLRDAWLDGKIASAEEETELLERLLERAEERRSGGVEEKGSMEEGE
jgi:tRNA nucleotidyltransferase (CCA-adding enzyme)